MTVLSSPSELSTWASEILKQIPEVWFSIGPYLEEELANFIQCVYQDGVKVSGSEFAPKQIPKERFPKHFKVEGLEVNNRFYPLSHSKLDPSQCVFLDPETWLSHGLEHLSRSGFNPSHLMRYEGIQVAQGSRSILDLVTRLDKVLWSTLFPTRGARIQVENLVHRERLGSGAWVAQIVFEVKDVMRNELEGCPYCQATDPTAPQCGHPQCPGRVVSDLLLACEKLRIDVSRDLIYLLVQEGFVASVPDLFALSQELSQQFKEDPIGFRQGLEQVSIPHVLATRMMRSVLTSRTTRTPMEWLEALGANPANKNHTHCLEGIPLKDFPKVLGSSLELGLVAWGLDPWNVSICQELNDLGCQPSTPKNIFKSSDGELPLAGMKICVTGEFIEGERKELQTKLASLGAEIKSGVSSKLTHLLAGTGAGSSKLSKAQDLGIEVLDKRWLRQVLKEAGILISEGMDSGDEI